MDWLQVLAIVLQLSDTALTCKTLNDGGRELNPVFGKNPTCTRIAAVKGAALLAIPLTPKRYRKAVVIGNIASGGTGLGLTVVLRLK